MSALPLAATVALTASLLTATPARQEAVDPELRAAVDRFFASQQEENIEAYLALWSATASRPTPEMLKYIFDAGDDVFSDIEITRVIPTANGVRLRVSVTRHRTDRPKVEGAVRVTRHIQMRMSLTFVREGSDWKLLREGLPVDDLALALLDAQSADERMQLMAAEPDMLTERLVLSISRFAGELVQKGDHGGAQRRYERMLEVARHIKDRRYEGEALQNIGNALYYQRNLAPALDAYEQRLGIERERANDEGIAAALSGIATIRYSFADYTAALGAYREALAIQERVGDEALIATSLISTGNVLYLQGDFDGAIRDYSRSRDLSAKILNTAGVAQALEGLGRVHLARGDFPAALEAFDGVLREATARGSRIGQGTASLNIGEAHYRLGNLDVARKTFEESRSHYDAAKDAANVGRAWQAIALTDLVAGRYALAESEYEKSIVSCDATSDAECIAAAMAGMAFAQVAQDKFTIGIATYRKAIDRFTALKRVEQVARTQIGLSHALLSNGDYEAALQSAITAHQTGIGLSNDDVLWRALVAEARALRRLEQPGPALAAARAASSALDKLVEAARTRPADPVARDSSSVFATLSLLHAESGDAGAAFDAVERMRAHDLRLSLAGVEREIARGMTAAEQEEERSIAVELVSLHAQRTREKSLPKPDLGRIARLEQTIDAAALRRTDQQQRLFERLPELRIWRGLMEPAVQADLSSVLAEGAVLLEFVIDDFDVVMVTARRAAETVEFAASVRSLSRKALAEAVATLTAPERMRSIPDWRRASAEFIVKLLPTDLFQSLTKASRLVVVPHEVLWRVPFEALPVTDRYLGEVARLNYAPSATAIVRALTRQGSPVGPLKTLTAAAPEIADSVRARIQQTAPSWILRPRESALSEVQVVQGNMPPDSLVALASSDLTEPALREGLPAADIIHLAAPFRINAASPLFSAVILSGEPSGTLRDPMNDAKLDAREVMNLDLRAQVAVLSDAAAMSMRDASDDAALMQWAWRAAGVRSLMIARWAVDPIAAELLLAKFHQQLREGIAPEEALRAAQTAVRQTETRAAPFYWTGWLLIGGG
jgi:tetratricopeptide (TPR) repeat protein